MEIPQGSSTDFGFFILQMKILSLRKGSDKPKVTLSTPGKEWQLGLLTPKSQEVSPELSSGVLPINQPYV